MENTAKTLEFERRWAMTAGIMAVGGVALVAISYVYAGTQIPSGDGVAAYLTKVDSHRGTLVVSNAIQAIGLSMLAAPLVYLFKAAAARSERVKTGLIGIMIAAPLFLGLASITNAVSTLDSATAFKNEKVERTAKCVSDKQAAIKKSGSTDATTEPAADVQKDCADDVADDVRSEHNGGGLAVGLGLAGVLGFAFSVVYVALWGMRLGLLTRFWGSLGIALGAVSFVFLQFTLIWFIYVGLLIVGWVPGGRPPAWASGEARPWLPPGQDDEEDEQGEEDVIEGRGEPVEAPEPLEADSDTGAIGERVKRKKRRQPPPRP